MNDKLKKLLTQLHEKREQLRDYYLSLNPDRESAAISYMRTFVEGRISQIDIDILAIEGIVER